MMGCHETYENAISSVFSRYGLFIGKDRKTPWIVMLVCIIFNIALVFGLFRIESLTDIEELYTPQNSQARKDRTELKGLFPNRNDKYFNRHALSDLGLYGEVIVRTTSKHNLLNKTIIARIKDLDTKIRNFSILDDEGKTYNFSDICAVFDMTGCVVGGDIIFQPEFQNRLSNISYPIFNGTRLSGIFGDAIISNSVVESARFVKLRYNLRDESAQIRSLSEKWEKVFEKGMTELKLPHLEIAFVHSNSRNTELNASTTGDIMFFSITFTLMITYAALASIGCNMNCVAWRPMLSLAGVLSTVLAIGAALGFMSLIGIKFVALVGVVPFLIIGIGLDDTFVLMSGMADAYAGQSQSSGLTELQKRLGFALKSSGIAITITSVTDFLAFAIGGSSPFLSVRNFCITTGIAVILCYVNQLFIFVPCMAINERRVEAERHFLTCMKLKKKDDITDRSPCSVTCCSGAKPNNRDAYDGPLEKYPKLLIKAIVLSLPCKLLILSLFAGYLAVSIWGVVNLRQGLELKNLALTDSYYYKFSTWDSDYFREDIPISFVIRSKQEYTSSIIQNHITELISRAHEDSDILTDTEINWLAEFKKTPLYNKSESLFIANLELFLNGAGSQFQTDIFIDDTKKNILATRFYVFTNNIKDSTKEGDMMLRMRSIASNSALDVFAYTPAFIFYEQYVLILKNTLQTVGIALAVMVVVTTVFMPQPVLIVLVAVTMLMILVGIFGFMYFWSLTLSSITMIHLIMTVGFSVDFSAHICHAFVSVSATDIGISTPICCATKHLNERNIRVSKAIDRSGGPIINAALSSIVGIVMLSLSSSYIFQSFFKLMSLVILFGLAHAVLFLPVVLSFIGPRSQRAESHDTSSMKNETNSEITRRIDTICLPHSFPGTASRPKEKYKNEQKRDDLPQDPWRENKVYPSES